METYRKMTQNVLLLLVMFVSGIMPTLEGMTPEKFNDVVATSPNPFQYDLHLTMLSGAKQEAEVCICMHGMGSDYGLSKVMRSNPALPYHIVAFNFPDYGHTGERLLKTTFGTIDELLPALYVWKRCVVDGGADKVHLYGFSAGGGAIINGLAVLNSSGYDTILNRIGINALHKQQILKAVQKGSVILEVPLKSFDEIADQGGGWEMRALAQRARENGMTPIQNLTQLHGLALNCFVYFTHPDEAIGNRDDTEFIRRLHAVNSNGQTIPIMAQTGGHTSYHPELWEAYQKFVERHGLGG